MIVVGRLFGETNNREGLDLLRHDMYDSFFVL
jgi:hypothetical protein